jgi:CHASE3 domain sensor protein
MNACTLYSLQLSLPSPNEIQMKKPLEIKMAPVIILAFMVISVLAAINYFNNKETKTSSYWLAHTQEVLYKSEEILSVIKDVEAGTRGFVITGNTVFFRAV